MPLSSPTERDHIHTRTVTCQGSAAKMACGISKVISPTSKHTRFPMMTGGKFPRVSLCTVCGYV